MRRAVLTVAAAVGLLVGGAVAHFAHTAAPMIVRVLAGEPPHLTPSIERTAR